MVIQKQPALAATAQPASFDHHPHALLQPLTHEASHLNPASVSRHAVTPSHMQLPPCCEKHAPSNHHCMRLLRPKPMQELQ
jgi:hypothetical protein